jgi:hypothetical protein
MCMQCVGAFGTACQAATLVGGPWLNRQYRRVRDALGLADMSVQAVERRQIAAAAAARRPQVVLRPGRAAPMLQRTAAPPSPVPFWELPVPRRAPRPEPEADTSPARGLPRRRLVAQVRMAAFVAAAARA